MRGFYHAFFIAVEFAVRETALPLTARQQCKVQALENLLLLHCYLRNAMVLSVKDA